MKKLAICLMGAFLLAMFAGCPKEETRKPGGEMDTPAHHVTMAERAIRNNDDWNTAHKEYNLALGLDPNYVPALIGDAVYYARLARDSKGGDRDKYFERAEDLRKKADSNAKENKDKIAYYTGLIEYNMYYRGNKWIEDSEDAFEKVMKLDAENEKAMLKMGVAYMRAYEWNKAQDMFSKVVAMNRQYREEADAYWQLLQKIVRARPGSVAAKKMVFVEKITRADVAALFVEEMHLPELWRKRGIKKWEEPAFKTPGEAGKKSRKDHPTANDIADHPLKNDIETVLALDIRGLEVFPDGSFKPNKKITRAEFAVMLEDIIIKVLNEPEELRSKYVGEAESKFHDMRTDHWAYNAAVVVMTRQIMPADLEGNFKPMASVSGVDSLLIIRRLMDYLKIG